MGILDYWAQRKAAKEQALKDIASDAPPQTPAEWLAWESRTTRYKGEDGQERAVLLWEDYERLLKWAKRDDS